MPLTDLDAVWFRIHSDREFRLRKQSPAELQQWPVPPERDATGWCIIRKDDGAMSYSPSRPARPGATVMRS